MSERPKILLVDDDLRWRNLISEVLEKSNYEIHSVERGIEAIERLEKEEFQLIICDLRMDAEFDGFDVLDYIMGKIPYLPVIILTAYCYPDTAKNAYRKGAFKFLVKGDKNTSNEQLRNVVADALIAGQEDEANYFETIIINRYPSFLSDLYCQIKSEDEIELKCQLQVTLVKSLIKFLSIIIICGYLQKGERSEETDSYIRPDLLLTGNQGEWFLKSQNIYKNISNLPGNNFMKVLSDLFVGKHKDLIINLIELHNKFHPNSFSQAGFQDFEQKSMDMLMLFLHELGFLSDYFICRMNHLKILKGGFYYDLVEFTGENQAFLPTTKTYHNLITCEEVIYLHLRDNDYFSLHPLVIFDTGGSERNKLFFFHSYSQNEIQYVSYVDNCIFTTDKYTDEFLKLLSRKEINDAT